jgi:hypothetical protein
MGLVELNASGREVLRDFLPNVFLRAASSCREGASSRTTLRKGTPIGLDAFMRC